MLPPPAPISMRSTALAVTGRPLPAMNRASRATS